MCGSTVRRERPHQGAQLRFEDVGGYRLTAFATSTRAGQLADLEVCHRLRARCQGTVSAAPRTPGLTAFPLQGFAQNRIWCLIVKPRVLWGLVYLVAVVAGCDCAWRWRSGAQAASCSAGARIPMAEYGRVVPAQCTHSAVASTGDINVLPRALVTDQLGLVQGA